VRKTLRHSSAHSRHELARECTILKKLQHPNIIKLLRASQSTNGDTIELFLRHGGMTLFDIVDNGIYFDYYNVCEQIARGVAYLHSRNVYHRDLKLENLTLDTEGEVHIIDFGLCVETDTNITQLTPRVGSISYMAPEMQRLMAYHGEKVDSWSVGVCFYSIYFASLPFKTPDTKDWRFQKIIKYQELTGSSCGTISKIRAFYDKDLDGLADYMEFIIDSLLCIDPHNRTCVSQLKFPCREKGLEYTHCVKMQTSSV
jgi:serine/threonine protein kinase